MQEYQQYQESLAAARSWMQSVQERLKANDSTQGPLGALEGRLRETERMVELEPEGWVQLDRVLVLAQDLLQGEDGDLKNQTNSELRDLKTLWEETCTYVTHCHSRIEWVWLHWSEYLKAYEEFQMWLSRQQCLLDVGVEQQLGLKEKVWQVEQHRVMVSDVHGQAALLDRLLDEAAALHNRTRDTSVDPRAQGMLQEAYDDVRDRAEERLSLLHKMGDEHQTYQRHVEKFQSWLLSKTKDLTDLMETDDTTGDKLAALRVLDDSVASEERTLQDIEGVAEAVRSNTCPAGAEVVVEEAEELRLGWQRLRQGLYEAGEGLRSSLDSHSQYLTRCQQLEEDISRLTVLLQGLDKELEKDTGPGDGDKHTEEQLVGQWRKFSRVRSTLEEEESQVEHLKAQLKELFRFSQDSAHLSHDVLAVVKEHQSVKSRATRLCSESESDLRNVLQDPLLVFSQWSHKVSQVLQGYSEVNDFSHMAMLVQSIEMLLKDSIQLKEAFSVLQVKRDLLVSVFGSERGDGLQGELSAAIRTRELLHTQLLQRKSRLQGLISQSEDFTEASDLIRSKLAGIRIRLDSADCFQPDILAKKSQLNHLKIILKDLEDLQGHITALETPASSSPSSRTQSDRLQVEWKNLHQGVRVKLGESEQSIAQHEGFHHNQLNLEKWMMITKQKLEIFCSPSGDWSIGTGHRQEAERALAEFPEKELQLQQVEVQGQRVLERTSEEGRIHILGDMKRLRESWTDLDNMSLSIRRLLDSSSGQSAGNAASVELSLDTVYRNQDNQPGRGSMEVLRLGGWSPGHMQLAPLDATDGQDSSSWTVFRSSGQVDCRTSGPEPRSPKSSLWTGRHGRTSGPRSGDGTKDTDESLSSGGASMYRKDSVKLRLTPSARPTESTTQVWNRRKEFETWLSQQIKLLSGVLSAKGTKLQTKDLRVQQDLLTDLRAGLVWGQEQFQLLLQESQTRDSVTGAEDADLEELRYRWMLYKSKLKDVGNLRTRVGAKKADQSRSVPSRKAARVEKNPGLLQRVCRLALPLWLLLLALLLLAFLLPLVDERNTCSLSNNFARSFNIMLHYNGPPPT